MTNLNTTNLRPTDHITAALVSAASNWAEDFQGEFPGLFASSSKTAPAPKDNPRGDGNDLGLGSNPVSRAAHSWAENFKRENPRLFAQKPARITRAETKVSPCVSCRPRFTPQI
ncbi:MAG: hypothetical protein LBE27_04160 [Deltaproteobacteria bacterium]|nr:hypothetical protein [Deltaproteobacteria bacterium]